MTSEQLYTHTPLAFSFLPFFISHHHGNLVPLALLFPTMKKLFLRTRSNENRLLPPAACSYHLLSRSSEMKTQTQNCPSSVSSTASEAIPPPPPNAHTQIRASALQIGTRGLDVHGWQRHPVIPFSRAQMRIARCELQRGRYALFSMTPRLCKDPSISVQDCTVLNSAKAHPLLSPILIGWRRPR